MNLLRPNGTLSRKTFLLALFLLVYWHGILVYEDVKMRKAWSSFALHMHRLHQWNRKSIISRLPLIVIHWLPSIISRLLEFTSLLCLLKCSMTCACSTALICVVLVCFFSPSFFFVDTRSIQATIVRGQNMQICHSPTCEQIDMSTADRLISVLRNTAGTPLKTLRSNASTMEYNVRLCVILHSLTVSCNYYK